MHCVLFIRVTMLSIAAISIATIENHVDVLTFKSIEQPLAELGQSFERLLRV